MFTLPASPKIALGCLAGLWCAAQLFAAEIAPVPTDQAIATILESKVILRQKGKYPGAGSEFGYNEHGHPKTLKTVIENDRYVGWATLVKTRSGELIVAFSGDRDSHVDPWGKTQLVRSLDQGKTWSEPETITSTPLDDRDAGIIQTKAGTLLVSWFTSTVALEKSPFPGAWDRYARHAEKVTQEIRDQWKGNWVRRSEDNGKTWGPPIRNLGSAPHGPIELRDGRLLYLGNAEWQGHKTMTIEQSTDDGRTWSVIGNIPKPEGMKAGLGEPHMVETRSGKLIALVRHEPKDKQCFLLQSESTDGGKTWTPLHSTGLWGFPPHVILLKNGWLMVAYGHRREPFGERAAISRDEGKTWDVDTQVSLIGAPGPDLGYPSSAQLDDGSLLTVYYQAEKLGQPTYLGSTHWRLKE